MIKIFRKIVLLGASCIISLSLSECIVRIFHLAPPVLTSIGTTLRLTDNYKLVYEFIPGAYVDDSRINNYGFKDCDFVKEKPPNTVRIAMLGDSVAQGMFIKYGKTFSEQLENILNQRGQETKNTLKYKVMNFSVGGYNLVAEVETLKNKVLQFTPDIVILNFFCNDNEPIPGLSWFFPSDAPDNEKDRAILFKKYYFSRNSLWHLLRRNLFYKSKLYLFMVYRFSNFKEENKKMGSVVKTYYNSIVTERKNKIFYDNLAEIDRLKKKHGFKFLICLHPHLLAGEHPNNYRFAEVAQLFIFPYFHMFEYYKKNTSPELIQINKEDTCHPNELGHLIIARAMLTELKKNGFIDKGL